MKSYTKYFVILTGLIFFWHCNSFSQEYTPDANKATRYHAVSETTAHGNLSLGIPTLDLRISNSGSDSKWLFIDSTVPRRFGMGLVYDRGRNRTVLFGGDDYGIQGDTWEWDGTVWTQTATTGPPARVNAAMCYDAARANVVLFGGWTTPDNYYGDTWIWDGTTWSDKQVSGPPSRANVAMTYDKQRERIVLFGGSLYQEIYGDTWEWDGTQWQQVSTTGPSPRIFSGMVYDTVRQRCVLFGGQTTYDGESLNDTWEWDGSSWTHVGTGGPPRRMWHMMTYDPLRNRTVLFGGRDGFFTWNLFDDTWEWDGVQWQEIVTDGPNARFGGGMVFDESLRKIVLIGGIDSTQILRDAWVYRPGPSITGKVFHDLNSNGIFDEGEYGIPNWKIILSGVKNDTALTDAMGYYVFEDLPIGTYTVIEQLHTDWEQTFPASPGTYSLSIVDSSTYFSDINFGNRNTLGLVAYYPFNGNANDESGNGNNGSVNGATPVIDRFGIPNRAYSFDGATNYIEIGDSPDFHSLNQVTLSVWFKTTDSSRFWTKMVGKHYDAQFGSFYIVWEHQYVRFSAITPHQYPGIASGNIAYGNWHHACGVYDGTLMSLYVDGVLVNSAPNSGAIKETNYPVTIGRSEKWNEYYHGSIDDIRIYNRALAESEIQALYIEGGLGSSISGMKFNDLNDNSVKDSGEVGLSHWKIKISGEINDSTYTDADGKYSFAFLPLGSYTISEESNYRWEQTFPSSGNYFISLTHEDSITGKDFGNYLYQGSISGKKFNDLDGDGVLDAGEPGMEGWLIHISPYDLYTTTNINGNYKFENLPPDTYTLDEFPKPYWRQTLPPQYGVHQVILSKDQVAEDINFGNQIIPNIKDLAVSVAGGVARPGFQKNFGIMYSNNGTEARNATIKFVHPSNTTFLTGSTSPPHTNYDLGTQTVTWDIGSITPGTIGFLSAAVLISPPPIVNIGDILTSCVSIEPISDDINPIDNNDCESEVVRGSYDPNDKQVTPAGEGENNSTPINSELEYLIRFQNTGTDTAFNIVIKDTLDPNLLLPMLIPNASSHPYKFEITGERELKWTFANIHLPDSNVNEPASHGFVSFRIRPKPTAVGKVIENTASIYFDYNPPLQTNTVKNLLTETQPNEWNMISIPVIVSDYRKSVLFPLAVSDAFSYESSYISYNILQNGVGYWVKIPESNNLPIVGLPILAETVTVKQGWNMIGSISVPIPTISIASDPPNIITTEFFGYKGIYEIEDTIHSDKSYWVKVNQNGSLILSSDFSSTIASRIKIVPTSELPPAPPLEDVVVKETPKQFALDQCYPNPFNPVTTINFQLPTDSRVTLKVYNVLGQLVTTLIDEIQQAGYRSVGWNASSMASGVYYYRFETTNINDPSKSFMQVRKMLLIK